MSFRWQAGSTVEVIPKLAPTNLFPAHKRDPHEPPFFFSLFSNHQIEYAHHVHRHYQHQQNGDEHHRWYNIKRQHGIVEIVHPKMTLLRLLAQKQSWAETILLRLLYVSYFSVNDSCDWDGVSSSMGMWLMCLMKFLSALKGEPQQANKECKEYHERHHWPNGDVIRSF